jgi:predicted ATPase
MNDGHRPIITDLRMENFCGFSEFAIHFDGLTVLVGPNNGGKTTALRAVRFLVDTLDLTLPSYAHSIHSYIAQKRELTKTRDAAMATAKEERERAVADARTNADEIPDRQQHQISQQIEQKYQQQLRQAQTNHQNGLINIERQRPVCRCQVKEVAQRQLVEDLDTFFYRHSPAAMPRLTARLTTRPVASVVTVAIERGTNNGLHASVEIRTEAGTIEELADQPRGAVLDSLLRLRSEFVRPASALLPSEKAYSWPKVQAALSGGKPHEVSRNQIHWLSEGKTPEVFQRVIDQVRHALPEVALNLPGRTRDENPNVVVNFREGQTTYDIAEAGNGMRTLLNVAAHLCLSDASVFLLDEPDSHLHSAVQREMCTFIMDSVDDCHQVILATHAPDMIDAFPLDAQLWIDRSQTTPRKSDDTTAILVELGALLPSEALESSGSTSLLYVEGKPDRKAITSLFASLGEPSWLTRCVISTLKGFGDATYVPGVVRFLREHHQKPYRAAVLLDSDYACPDELVTQTSEYVVTARLACKELENLLLLSPEALLLALQQCAERRQSFVGRPVSVPTMDTLTAMILEVSQESFAKESIIDHWIMSRMPPNADAGHLRTARQEFDAFWSNAGNRLRFGPGKKMLARVRALVQERYQLSLPSTPGLFAHYAIPEDVSQVLGAIRHHLMEIPAVEQPPA